MRADQYHIKFVDTDELDGKDFAFLECDGEMYLAVTRPITEAKLEESWAAFRDMIAEDLAHAS